MDLANVDPDLYRELWMWGQGGKEEVKVKHIENTEVSTFLLLIFVVS